MTVWPWLVGFAAVTSVVLASIVVLFLVMAWGTRRTQGLAYFDRGRGDLGNRGAALYSLSPWIESDVGVPIDEAPTVGEARPVRIIKTRLPASLLPCSPHARYIYMVRHPASCFASCADFLAGNLGAFTPGMDVLESWFRSDMVSDFPAVTRRVAHFLAPAALSTEEEARIVERCDFEYKRRVPICRVNGCRAQ